MTVTRLITGLGAVLLLTCALTSRTDAAQSRRDTQSPNAAASKGLHHLGSSIGTAVATDGQRHAAYLSAERTVRVLDEHGRLLQDVVLPTEQPPLLKTVEAVGGNHVLLGDRASSAPPPKLIEIGAAKVFDVDARPWWAKWDGWSLTGVGRQWLSADGRTSHGGAESFLNWHTGRVATDLPTYYEPANTARAAPDLNVPSLWRTMCAPLRRQSSHDPDTGEGRGEGLGVWRSYEYRPPFGLTISRGGRLLLQRCGQRKSTVLSRCRRGCGYAQLGAGVVTWRERRRALFYQARTRCRRAWRVPALPSDLIAVAHTRSRIFISTIDSSSYGQLQPRPLWRVYTAALPSC